MHAHADGAAGTAFVPQLRERGGGRRPPLQRCNKLAVDTPKRNSKSPRPCDTDTAKEAGHGDATM